MDLPPLIPGMFLRRDNRFRVTVEIDDQPVAAHVPNSGRLTELLIPGRPCWLAPMNSTGRKTGFDLKLVEYADTLVSVDARLPNSLFAEAQVENRLSPFRCYDSLEREVRHAESRLDFRLAGPAGTCWVEVKSVTLIERGTARFPDAPTARGTRHLRTLASLVREGDRAAVVFVVQRADASRFAPHSEADPVFATALREASTAGVGVYAWTCSVNKREIAIAQSIPVGIP